MPTSTPLKLEQSTVGTISQPYIAPPCDLDELISLSVRGLVPMFDPDKQIFCDRLVRTEKGIVRQGLSPRYTIMTLLGLREVELAGIHSPFDTRVLYANFARNTDWIQGLGDLGLLIWLTAIFDPEQLPTLLTKFESETSLDRYVDAKAARTMELAWFLAGLSHAVEASPKLLSRLTNLSRETYHRLTRNQGAYGLFGHMGTTKSFAGLLRGRIGSFADQVYPIYAMSKYSRAFHIEEALKPVLQCAKAICDAQGPLGQWWWLYDARNGRVSSHYPVYAVHQHGMAPMALFAAEQASGKNFGESLYKGLSWLYGKNELGVDMIDIAQSLIWRCVLPKNKSSKYWDIASSRVRLPNQKVQASSLKVLYEQRPYEFGWLLFALAQKG
jgi:hypothetical protein